MIRLNMRCLIVNFAPAPLFLIGLIYNIYNFVVHGSHHEHHSWEMTVMWAVMTLAHISPWIKCSGCYCKATKS